MIVGPVARGPHQLAIGADDEGSFAIDSAGRQIRVGGVDGTRHLVDADRSRGQLARIDVNPDGKFLRSEDVDLRDTAHHRDALRDLRLRNLVEHRERQRRRSQDDEEDRLI
jgi:hypothetical protein